MIPFALSNKVSSSLLILSSTKFLETELESLLRISFGNEIHVDLTDFLFLISLDFFVTGFLKINCFVCFRVAILISDCINRYCLRNLHRKKINSCTFIGP